MFWLTFKKNIAGELRTLKEYVKNNPEDEELKAFVSDKEIKVNRLLDALKGANLNFLTLKCVRRKFYQEGYLNPHTALYLRRDLMALFDYKQNGCLYFKRNVEEMNKQ